MPKKYISYSFMKYVRPIWYFHQNPYEGKYAVWVEYDQLSTKEKELINYDKDYSNSTLSRWDASYQALMKGVVKQAGNNIQSEEIELLPADIYRFVRKYYKKIWLYFTFLQRLFSFYNPVLEFKGLWQTQHIKKENLFHTNYDYDEYSDYDSSLIKSNPLVNIIIPTFNRYETLNRLLEDLDRQVYNNFEVIVIDQSENFQNKFYKSYNFKIQIIKQDEPALWRARNTGIKSAESEYLLFLDDDSRIESDWILEHLKCIDYFKADISSGVSLSNKGDKIPDNYHYFRCSDQLDTGNVLILKKVFHKIGLFDLQFEKMRQGDGEFGIRSYLNGFKNISNPNAFRKHLKFAKGGLRDIGHWDGFRSKNIFAPKPVPSVIYFYRKYWGNSATLLNLLHSIPLSYCPYYIKGSAIGYIISLVVFFLFLPIVFSQVVCSWYKSTAMLERGEIIEVI